MSIEEKVVALLQGAGIGYVYAMPPSVSVCAEPVVVGAASWEGREEYAGASRNVASLKVYAVRNLKPDALDLAHACEDALRRAPWEQANEDGFSIVRLEAGVPAYAGADTSGRHVYTIDVSLTAQRVY